MSVRDPATVASDVLAAAAGSAFGDLTGPPVDVDAIAEELCGLLVAGAKLTAHADAPALPEGVALSGLLLAGQRRLLFDAHEAARSPGRRRFTIAHELGHWYLHHAGGGTETRYCRSDEVGVTVTSTRAREREANRFAAALLMPEPLVRAETVRLRCNVGLLARGFGVSEAAMRVRLIQLDVLPSYMR